MLDDIGFLDDDFFFSCEDVDMGWRANLAGWRVLYVPQAVVYHKLKATGGGVTSSYYDGRNFLYLTMEELPGRPAAPPLAAGVRAQLRITRRGAARLARRGGASPAARAAGRPAGRCRACWRRRRADSRQSTPSLRRSPDGAAHAG